MEVSWIGNTDVAGKASQCGLVCDALAPKSSVDLADVCKSMR